MQKLYIRICIVVVIVGTTAYLFLMQQQKAEVKNPHIVPISTQNDMSNLDHSDSKSPTEVSKTEAIDQIIEIEGENDLTKEALNELYRKVINPYITYNNDSLNAEARGTVQRLVFTKRPDSTDTQPFNLCSTFESGRNECIIVSKIDGEFNWWQPSCMDGCSFSPGFRASYPEIVKNYTPNLSKPLF